jgi:putative nucleotidyltransferase with HDIG domain
MIAGDRIEGQAFKLRGRLPKSLAEREQNSGDRMSTTIDVRELRVGMYVHLDIGWMSHPFPLSSFKICSDDQIATIRSLGLKQVRWVPERSDSRFDPQDNALAHVGDGAAADEAHARAQARREALARQRAAGSLAERQYAEATQAWREMSSKVASDPGAARAQAEALTRALLDKMLGDHELCIRLLTEGAGDRATAHALNVGLIALLMGRAFGLDKPDLAELGMGALLHDIGKQEVPDRLRFPDEGFTGPETAIYREHVAHGVRHGKRMGLSSSALLVIAQHHEQADGSGFPQGMPIEKMAAAARIVALVNRYDNLCNPLLPSKALTPHEALSLLFAQGKQKFDATMLAGFVRMMGVYPPGSLVQLTDDRYGMVMSVNSSRPLKPRVLVHDPKVARDDALYLDLEACADVGVRRSLKPAQMPPEALEYLAPGRRIAYFFEPIAAPRPAELDELDEEHPA